MGRRDLCRVSAASRNQIAGQFDWFWKCSIRWRPPRTRSARNCAKSWASVNISLWSMEGTAEMNNQTDGGLLEAPKAELNIYYMTFEVLVAIFAVVGNALVIFVFRKERRLRRRTNYYIVSLAAADFLVGLLGIPFAIMASIGWPTNLHACLFTVSLLVVLCTISIFCLVAVSVDRYWAILHPMGYSRNVRTKTALGECCCCLSSANKGKTL